MTVTVILIFAYPTGSTLDKTSFVILSLAIDACIFPYKLYSTFQFDSEIFYSVLNSATLAFKRTNKISVLEMEPAFPNL